MKKTTAFLMMWIALSLQGPAMGESLFGSCTGQIYIFHGDNHQCRSWSLSTVFDDCCEDDEYLLDLLPCRQTEKDLGSLKAEGLCVYLGEYCSDTEDPCGGLFGGCPVCVEESKSYCCFNSKLARIVVEQGRAQLKTFDGWGSAGSPDCRGFTPEEFATLDFSEIDMSSFYGDITTKSNTDIQSDITQTIEGHLDQ